MTDAWRYGIDISAERRLEYNAGWRAWTERASQATDASGDAGRRCLVCGIPLDHTGRRHRTVAQVRLSGEVGEDRAGEI